MRTRLTVTLAAMLVLAACDGGDAELSTSSTIVTGPSVTDVPSSSTSTTRGGGAEDDPSTGTSLAGEPVGSFEVVEEIPNDDGIERHFVIPNGAYTDVDLENFLLELLEAYPDLYGAEIFDSDEAAAAFLVAEADRSEAEQALLDRHHFMSLDGRASFDFRGPFSEFSGGAIGS